jgi:hypothetical protein
MGYTTLLDVIKSNAANKTGIGLIDELSRRHPFMSRGTFRAIRGINYDTLVQTGASNTGGSFRKMNQGIPSATTTEELRRVETYPIQPRLPFLARKTSGILETELQAHERQMFYGYASGIGNPLGYPGLMDAYDPVNLCMDAGGTTAYTGSSVWLVRHGPDAVTGVLANEGKFEFGALRIESIADANDPTKFMDMYVQTLLAQIGLQVTNILAVARIKKLTSDPGHTLTDKLLMDAIALFPQDQPNAIYMSLRSLGHLRDSRTATNPTGAPAVFPTSVKDVEGQDIPIYPTGGILNTESLTL